MLETPARSSTNSTAFSWCLGGACCAPCIRFGWARNRFCYALNIIDCILEINILAVLGIRFDTAHGRY
jgi:hypothetical protein